MVRIFVPEGEGQHAIVRRPFGAYPAQNALFASQMNNAILAVGVTGLLALVGRSQPGTYLKAVAYISAFQLPICASVVYYKHEINKGIFKMEGIEPKPGKLWEETKHWTLEDTSLGGGALGVLLALNPRALPGVYGWKRFFGAATVGMAAGYGILEPFLGGMALHMKGMLYRAQSEMQRREYQRLQQDEEAKKSLSLVGRTALKAYANPTFQILTRPMDFALRKGGGASTRHATQQPQDEHDPLQQVNGTSPSVVMQLQFKIDELSSPDMENGLRTYRTVLGPQDAAAVHESLEKFQDLKKRMESELTCVWRRLAHSEQALLKMSDTDADKELAQREMQLMYTLVNNMVTKNAIYGLQIVDAQKRLCVIEQNGTGLEEIPLPQGTTDNDNLTEPNTFEMVTEEVRQHWSRQKEMLGQLEHGLTQFNALAPEKGTQLAENHEELKKVFKQLSMNQKATERLLSWCEEQARLADERARHQGTPGNSPKNDP